jgi:UMF1 family MFS transporter
MKLFLLAYFFFNDAIITSQNNFPIYVQRVFSTSDSMKSMLLIGILMTSVLGAFLSGLVVDKIGLKKTLSIVLGSWVVILPLMGITSSFPIFICLAILMGFFYGATFTVSRATMVALCPKEKINFGFSFYTLAERFSTLFGPIA